MNNVRPIGAASRSRSAIVVASLLFAYGTLMPADQEAAARGGWTPDLVRGRLYDLGRYPALIDLDDPAAGWVEGYVRSVEQADLDAADGWEDVESGLYRRALTTTRNNNRVWVYVYARPLPAHASGPRPRWRSWAPADPE
jgi:gamma-glutamylcyclotransferase (GGCT)/AIG2-like uncharacterized protein YtfP